MQNIKPLQTSKKIMSNKEAMEELERYSPKEEPKEIPEQNLEKELNNDSKKETGFKANTPMGILLKILEMYSIEVSEEINLDTIISITDDLAKKLESANKERIFRNVKMGKERYAGSVLANALNNLYDGVRIEKIKEKPNYFKVTWIGATSAGSMYLPEDIKKYLQDIIPKYKR